MSFDSDGNDSFELNPFGDGEYDPSIAFAMVAASQAEDQLRSAEALVASHLDPSCALSNQIAASARKRSQHLLDQMRSVCDEVRMARRRVQDAPPGSQALELAIADAVNGFHRLKSVDDDLIVTVQSMLHPDLPVAATQPVVPTQLDAPGVASAKIYQSLAQWVQLHRGTEDGALSVVQATPGTGKTHQMLRIAYDEQQLRQRVVFAVRTKEMIVGPDAELIHRAHRVSPLGKVSLAVLTGRDETNCYKHETVAAVMAHGYSPGPAVCSRCEYYPDNARMYGFGICPYYDERIRAHNVAQGARRGVHRHYAIIFTTHSSYIAANRSSGGRWGSFWPADLVLMDEDPTDAMEVDIALSEAQCGFVSRGPDTMHAGIAAELFRNAIEIGREERKKASVNGFRANGSTKKNSHPIHTDYDSVYAGRDLHDLIRLAYFKLARSYNLPSLAAVLRDVTHGMSFHVDPGELADVQTVDDINAMDVPPRSLSTVADLAYAELEHVYAVRAALYEKITGRMPPPDATDELEAHTDLGPVSYVTRLECQPRNPQKGRVEDEWRFVVREFRPFTNHTASVIVGDAYAQKAHYEQLFGRPADVIETVATLHEEALITRHLDGQCNIGTLREGGLQRVLNLVQIDIADHVRPGERVLIYGHGELLPGKLSNWMADMCERYQITMAFEHWWGGRGKDQYREWEHTYTISDPVQSLSGIRHVANARAFRDSVNAKTLDERLFHVKQQQIDHASLGRGVVRALRNSDHRIVLEHDRMNVAELTQAMHRSRPVHHPTRIVVIGTMEQSVDLVAQTVTVVPSEYRKVRWAESHRKVGAKTRQVVGAIDAFVSLEEAWRAIRAIVDWYGVYSPWFAHSLVTAAEGNPSPVLLILDSDGLPSPEGGGSGQQVPGDADDLGVDVGATEPAALPNRRSVIRRVWDPPTYWQLLKNQASLPKAIRDLHLELPRRQELRSVMTGRWPKWAGGLRERYPTVFYDPTLVKRPDTALAIYYDVVDTQYGPVVDGRQHRPNFRKELPACLKTVPF